jgi:hypothetical protein
MSTKADSPSTSTGTKSPIGSTHSHSPSKDVDESCVLMPSESDLQGDSLNTTTTGFDVVTPLSALRDVASRAHRHFLQATIRKGRRSFGQLKDNIGKLAANQEWSSPSRQWSQEPAPTIMGTVQATFWEVGSKYPVFSPDIISGVAIRFVENDLESWDKLQARVREIALSGLFEDAIQGIINRFFMFPRHKMSVVRTLLVKSIVATTLAMGLEAWRQIELSGSSKTAIDSDGFRMFDLKEFCKQWAMYMKQTGFPFTQDMMDRIASGVGSNGLCVENDDPIVLILEAWEGRAPKGSTEILRAYSQASNDILPKKVDTFKRKEEPLLYDKDQKINLDDSPLEHFFILYAKAFEKAVYIGAAMLADYQEELLRGMWLMVGITSWKALLNNVKSATWCEDLKGLTKQMLVYFWPEDCSEDFRKIQEFALVLIPLYMAHYAQKVLDCESRRYLKDLSLLGNKGFYDMFAAAVMSGTPMDDGFEEPEDDLIAEVLAKAETRGMASTERKLGRLKGEADDIMERVQIKKSTEDSEFTDSGQLSVSPVVSSGSSSIMSPSNAPDTGEPFGSSESLQAGMAEVPRARKANVEYPDFVPPKTMTHLHGFWGKNPGGTPTWRIYFPPLKYDELPANIKFKDYHWVGRTLPDGTLFAGKKLDGTSVFQPLEMSPNFGDKSYTKMPEKPRNQGNEALSETGEVGRRVEAQDMDDGPRNAKKPGAYEPGGVPRPLYSKGNDVSFNDNVEQYIIPSRHDEFNASWEVQHNAYDNYYGQGSRTSPGQPHDESFQGVESNVPSMAERFGKQPRLAALLQLGHPFCIGHKCLVWVVHVLRLRRHLILGMSSIGKCHGSPVMSSSLRQSVLHRALQIQDSMVVIRVIVGLMDTLRILTIQVGLDKDQRHHTAIQEARGQILTVVWERLGIWRSFPWSWRFRIWTSKSSKSSQCVKRSLRSRRLEARQVIHLQA